jgi:uncharacterized protein YcbX
VYPIKSLRPTQVSKAIATKHGLAYDRRFMIVELNNDGNGHKNMDVCHYPQMTQFLTDINLPEGNSKGSIVVEFIGSTKGQSTTLEIPLQPNTEKLESIQITMHRSSTNAFKMPAEYNSWFSSCFGSDVVLAYLGENLRDVLFEEMILAKNPSWLPAMARNLLGSSNLSGEQITFADCAPYLIVSKTSLDDVSSLLPDGEDMDVTKFRPNFVVQGAEQPWEEDFWGKITINNAEFTMAHNCGRCVSINVDYKTGQPGSGPSGEILKKLQKNRRVDPGNKWSPIFGRYSFWNPKNGTQVLSVGDVVNVVKMNKERTEWSKKCTTPILIINKLTEYRLEALISPGASVHHDHQ